jgi:hypothetical protein
MGFYGSTRSLVDFKHKIRLECDYSHSDSPTEIVHNHFNHRFVFKEKACTAAGGKGK